MAVISSGRRRLLKLGEPAHRIDGFAGFPAAVVAGFEGVGVDVGARVDGVEGVEGVVGTVGVLGVVPEIEGAGGAAMVEVEGEEVVDVAVEDALPSGGITSTCPTQIRLGLEMLLAR